MKKKLIIAVDGTAGSGKTVTFQKIAEKLNYKFVDTGLMYRAFTLLALKKQINLNNKKEIINLINDFNYEVKKQRVYLNKEDVTEELHSFAVLESINYITVIKEVRQFLKLKQQEIANEGGVIEVGRDITSNVLPDADLKIFLDSAVEERAKRRYLQNKENKIIGKSLEEICKDVAQRDFNDKTRENNPLILVKDAWYIDNTNLSLDDVINLVITKVQKMENEN